MSGDTETGLGPERALLEGSVNTFDWAKGVNTGRTGNLLGHSLLPFLAADGHTEESTQDTVHTGLVPGGASWACVTKGGRNEGHSRGWF